MKIRASFLTLTAGVVLTISGLGVSAHSTTSALGKSGAMITDAHSVAVTSDGDGNDPWPKPGP
jgi:hypothetical protein